MTTTCLDSLGRQCKTISFPHGFTPHYPVVRNDQFLGVYLGSGILAVTGTFQLNCQLDKYYCDQPVYSYGGLVNREYGVYVGKVVHYGGGSKVIVEIKVEQIPLTSHHVNISNEELEIRAVGKPIRGQYSRYLIKNIVPPEQPQWKCIFDFQDGLGQDGITDEALLAIVEHRLSSQTKCRATSNALDKVQEALMWLGKR